MMRLSQRAHRIGESATLSVSRKARELRERGVEIIDLSAGEPDFASPACAVEAAREALANGFTRYTPAAGIPELRRAISERYSAAFGAPWEMDQVIVSVGGKGALFELSLALFETGDEVVLPAPYWVSFPEHIRFCGAMPVFVPTAVEDGFRIHGEAVVAAITDKTKAVLVNTPCNPTGGVASAQDLRMIAQAAADRGVLLLVDETYERFVYGGLTHASGASLAREFPETIVLVSSFSKTYAMTGWRLGYAIGPRSLIGPVANIQSHATSNATSFAMPGAVAALESADEDVQKMLTEFGYRREKVSQALAEMEGVECRPPDGAFYAFPNVEACYTSKVSGSVAMSKYLLEEARVAVVPGVAFGDDRHVRISFATSRDALREGMERIRSSLASA